MELLEEIKYSLENQSRKQGETLLPSSDRTYIALSLYWKLTIEGYLFWNILHTSYVSKGIYDYILIVKLYNRYGKDIFKINQLYIGYYYRFKFDEKNSTLTDEGFEKLCKYLEEDGAIRRD